MKQRRILHVSQTARGGSAFGLYRLVRGLDKSQYESVVLFHSQEHPYIGHKLTELGTKVITLEKKRQGFSSASSRPTRHRDIAGWLETHFGKIAGEVYVFVKSCYQFMRWEAPRVWPIMRAIRENRTDLVHLNNDLRHGKPGIVAAWLTKTPCIAHVHMFHELNRFDKLFFRFVDFFIYVSNAVAESYIAQGILSVKGTVIHNAIDLSEFSTDFDRASLLSEFGWTNHESVVGVVGRLDWWKGHEYFLEAMAEVSQEIPNLKILIVGEIENTPLNQEYYQKLQSMTESLGLKDKTVFTEFRSDIPRLMSALDVLVLSSSMPEPFGLVVIEGMAAGKPVVATAAGGVLDIIEHEKNGLLVPCKNSKAMAQAILQLLANRELAKRIGLAARQRVAEKFTMKQHVARVQSVYDAIMGLDQN